MGTVGGGDQNNGYRGPQFREPRGTTQWGLTFKTLSNVAVDSVVQNWLSMKLEDIAVIHDGLGHAVGRSLEVFYADNGFIGLWDLEWLQGVLNVMIGPFLRIGLMDNVAKSKTMTCQMGEIWLGMSEEEVGW